MTEKWFQTVNDLLAHHKYAYNGVLIRFGATKYPFPTVSLQVFEDNEKIAEWSITRLEQLISDLQDALTILKKARIQARRERREQRKQEEDEEEETEDRRESRKSRRKNKQSKRRKPRRD